MLEQIREKLPNSVRIVIFSSLLFLTGCENVDNIVASNDSEFEEIQADFKELQKLKGAIIPQFAKAEPTATPSTKEQTPSERVINAKSEISGEGSLVGSLAILSTLSIAYLISRIRDKIKR